MKTRFAGSDHGFSTSCSIGNKKRSLFLIYPNLFNLFIWQLCFSAPRLSYLDWTGLEADRSLFQTCLISNDVIRSESITVVISTRFSDWDEGAQVCIDFWSACCMQISEVRNSLWNRSGESLWIPVVVEFQVFSLYKCCSDFLIWHGRCPILNVDSDFRCSKNSLRIEQASIRFQFCFFWISCFSVIYHFVKWNDLIWQMPHPECRFGQMSVNFNSVHVMGATLLWWMLRLNQK